MRFSKRKLHFLFSPFLCWKIDTEKKKNKKGKIAKKHIKIGFFFKVVIQKCEKSKKRFLAKIA